MKIKEAIEIINGTTSSVSAKDSDNVLHISSKNTAIYGDWFLKMPMNATNWEPICKEWGGLSPNIRPEDLALVMDVIQQLLDTPVKDRFPEKKYCLRWIDDDAGKSFLGLHGKTTGHSDPFWFIFGEPNLDAIFTESELNQLKKDNPRLAPAIDTMKEEIMTDEN